MRAGHLAPALALQCATGLPSRMHARTTVPHGVPCDDPFAGVPCWKLGASWVTLVLPRQNHNCNVRCIGVSPKGCERLTCRPTPEQRAATHMPLRALPLATLAAASDPRSAPAAAAHPRFPCAPPASPSARPAGLSGFAGRAVGRPPCCLHACDIRCRLCSERCSPCATLCFWG